MPVTTLYLDGLLASPPALQWLMSPRLHTILTGHNMPKIRQAAEPEPSIINEKTIADFTKVVEQTGILKTPVPEDADRDGQ